MNAKSSRNRASSACGGRRASSRIGSEQGVGRHMATVHCRRPGGSRLKTIDQFMWPYQDSFREGVQHLARSVFGDIGFEDGAAVVFLVGLAAPDHQGRHAVCIEPEDGPWKLETFATVPEDVERAIPADPMQ